MFDGLSSPTRDSVQSTSRTLLERVRLRDPHAWGRFVQLYGPTIYDWAQRSALQPHDAADIVQDVFQAVASHLEQFRRDRPGDSFRGWLRTVTANKIRDFYRRRPPATLDPAALEARLAAMPPPPDDEPLDQHRARLARRALDLIETDFEPTSWRAFLATAVDGRSAADVARDLGLSPAAVYKAKSRVLLRLRRELEGLLD